MAPEDTYHHGDLPNALRAAADSDAKPALTGRFSLLDGRCAIPSFELLARRCLNDRYSPDTVAEATGVPATTIRRLAAELAHAAFDAPVVIALEGRLGAGKSVLARAIGRGAGVDVAMPSPLSEEVRTMSG